MKKLLLIGFALSSFSFAQMLPPIGLDYYGKVSTEAILEFESEAEIPHTTDITLAAVKKAGRIQDGILVKLDYQIQHLMGIFQSGSFTKEFGFPGVLGQTYEIEFLSVKKISAKRKIIKYKFSGKVVFHSEAFGDKNSVLIPLKLPRSYEDIYALGLKGDVNLCSDEHYNSEDDFWYFWDPDMYGCPLKGDLENVLRFNGKLKRIANTISTYPEYNLLYGDNGNGKVMKTSLFLGYIDDIEDFSKPNKNDDGFIAMKDVEAELEELGYVQSEKKDAFREYANGHEVKGINFYRLYEKEFTTKTGNKITSQVELLLSDTGVDSIDATFHRYLVPALVESDLIVYDGHSGLGANLSLDNLPVFAFKPKKYQIIYFNGCSSYPYFNGNYFDAKGGSKYMELITSGLPTLTSSSASNMMAFAGPFLSGSTQSYQRLLTQIENSNGEDNGTYLVGVNGDEDNKFRP